MKVFMNIQLFDNATVRVDAENLVCITDIYKIAVERGLDGGKNNPYDWSRPERKVKSGSTSKTDDVTSSGRQFIDFVAKSLNVACYTIYKTKRGKGGGTYAHKDIAIAYAMYLGGDAVRAAIVERIGEIDQILKAFENFHVDDEIVDAMKQTYNVNKLYVYAIKEESTGNIKIGISANPRRRLEQLQTGNSSSLTLVAVKEAVNGYADEAQLHLTNSTYHVRGEWFSGQASIN